MSAERLEELLKMFGPAARRADPWPIHWVGGGDAGPDWCFQCCKAVAKRGRRTREYPGAIVDGGWDDARESDGPAYCSGCGRLLGYSLTSYGLADEIDHWREDPGIEQLTLVQAYEVEALLEAALGGGSDGQIADAIAIGERMAKLLPESAEVLRG